MAEDQGREVEEGCLQIGMTKKKFGFSEMLYRVYVYWLEGH